MLTPEPKPERFDGKTRRWRRIRLVPDTLLTLFKPGVKTLISKVVADPVPEDAVVVGCRYSRTGLDITVGSAEFAEVPEGQDPPMLDPFIEFDCDWLDGRDRFRATVEITRLGRNHYEVWAYGDQYQLFADKGGRWQVINGEDPVNSFDDFQAALDAFLASSTEREFRRA